MGRKSKKRQEIEALYGPDAPDDIEYWDKLHDLYDSSDEEKEVPFCCQTCGGYENYPDCKDSCSIFDD